MESEFIALVEIGKEAQGLRDFLLEILLISKDVCSIWIYCDSQTTLVGTYSSIYNERSIHISIQHDYVRKLIKGETIPLTFMKSKSNMSDLFTKPITKPFTYDLNS